MPALPEYKEFKSPEPDLLQEPIAPVYDSINNALEELEKAGYTLQFIKKQNFIYCLEKDLNFYAHELQITEVYRHENKTAPSENAVVYKIEASGYGLKGVLLNS